MAKEQVASADLPVNVQPGGNARSGTYRNVIRIVLAVAATVAFILLGRKLGAYVPAFTAWVHGLGAWGPIAFIAGYVAATIAFVPGSLLTLAAGAIFGLLLGTLYVFIGASLGATAAFLIARYLARGAVERKLEGNERFAAIDRAIGREGRKIVLLLRLSPVFPFNLLNYGLGLTQVRLGDYVVACVGMLPGTILYVYSGMIVGDVAALAGGAAPQHGPGYYGVLALGAAATLVVTTIVTRAARRALREVTDDAGRPNA
ncbi:MAG TPA: TVP38/TMEM64 family protein [Gemmatimonadales bacterium]|nr:TVP38/TMEM64 family protein [Gemmatimonadales bacterium]